MTNIKNIKWGYKCAEKGYCKGHRNLIGDS